MNCSSRILAAAVLLGAAMPAFAISAQFEFDCYKLIDANGNAAYVSEIIAPNVNAAAALTGLSLAGYSIHTPAMADGVYADMPLAGAQRQYQTGPTNWDGLASTAAGAYQIKWDFNYAPNTAMNWSTYTDFTVSSMDSTTFLAASPISLPTSGQVFDIPNPTFQWTAPTDVSRATRMVVQALVNPDAGGEGFAAVASATHIGAVDIPWDANSWRPGAMPNGAGSFAVNYSLTLGAAQVISTPVVTYSKPAHVSSLNPVWAVSDPQFVTTTYANFTITPEPATLALLAAGLLLGRRR
jgi:hypothetical protein